MAYRLIKIADKILNIFIYLCLIVVFLFCLYALFDTIKIYTRASNNNVSVLKPNKNDPVESFNALKRINKDVCAWITLENTSIDYPVVKGKDNIEYLNKDVYKKYSLSGSLFLDYRISEDFTDKYSIIFGHHMNGGAMFGDVQKFSNKDFFDKCVYGEIFTQNAIYKVEVFAFISTDAYDWNIYGINKDDNAQQEKLIEYIKNKATNYREVELSSSDNIICLSTCSTATTNGRHVILLKVIAQEKIGGD